MGGGGGGFIGDVVDSIGGFVDDTLNTAGDIVKTAFDVAGNVVSIVSPDAGNALKQVGTVANTTFDVVGKTVGEIIKDPSQLTKNPSDIIELALSVAVLYFTDNPYPLVAYAAVKGGAINGFTQGLVDAKIIPPEQAIYFNIVFTTITKIAAWSTVEIPLPSEVRDALSALGVAQTLYGLYQVSEMQMKLKEYLDQLRAYLEKLKQQLSEQSFQEAQSYATGKYYKYFAGQQYFNLYLPSRERYTPTDVQVQCYGIFNESAINVDAEIQTQMWDDKNVFMAGGAGFIKNSMQGVFIGNS